MEDNDIAVVVMVFMVFVLSGALICMCCCTKHKGEDPLPWCVLLSSFDFEKTKQQNRRTSQNPKPVKRVGVEKKKKENKRKSTPPPPSADTLTSVDI